MLFSCSGGGFGVDGTFCFDVSCLRFGFRFYCGSAVAWLLFARRGLLGLYVLGLRLWLFWIGVLCLCFVLVLLCCVGMMRVL